MCKKLKTNFTFVRGFAFCVIVFILFVIAFFGFKAYPEVFSDIGVTQYIENIFHKNENTEDNTVIEEDAENEIGQENTSVNKI